MAYQYVPGATAVGIAFSKGVVLAAEKRVAYGTFVMSRSGKKVFRITDRVGAACAGMVADMQVLIKEVSLYAKIREMELGRPLPPNSIAKLMSVLMYERRSSPLLTQVIVGGIGYDGNAIYSLDPLGSVIPDDYTAVGSGAEMAIGIIESEYKKELSEEEAKELALRSIKSAIRRDAASGDGVDMLVITEGGMYEESRKFSS